MDFEAVVRSRRMCRDFLDRPVPRSTVEGIIDVARRAPSAGHAQGREFLVLEGDETSRLWDLALPAGDRSSFRWPGLLEAPVLVLPTVSQKAYLRRYSQPDKAGSGLGESAESWRVPYWYVDGGCAVMTMLLAACAAGLGALFFGLFDNEQAVAEGLGIPPEHQPLGVVALGYPASETPSRSTARQRPALEELIHRGEW
ncbi:MAG: Coenzyme F420:L-glutamate ligase [Acidimicrobiales bacterium]|nr:MAG: nitroreductase family protein [Actinomycetota bacterium]MBV6509610.1 Coenzyme F420:L-glutamate ligase [Acidimicrobiales bacterium]RIK06529.1 MAG: nitroreductase [Acidobacteriota bacterium]